MDRRLNKGKVFIDRKWVRLNWNGTPKVEHGWCPFAIEDLGDGYTWVIWYVRRDGVWEKY